MLQGRSTAQLPCRRRDEMFVMFVSAEEVLLNKEPHATMEMLVEK